MHFDSDEPAENGIGGIKLNKSLNQEQATAPIIWAAEKFVSVNIFKKDFILLFLDLDYS